MTPPPPRNIASAPGIRAARHSWVTDLSVSFIFLVLAGASALFYLQIFQPVRWIKNPTPTGEYNSDAMRAVMAPDQVKVQQDKILGFGSRFLGQPGMYATADYIRHCYEEAGLEVYEQDLLTAAPKTEIREISRVDALGNQTPLTDVQIFPFMPNQLQPVATPAEGITGELIVLDQNTLHSRARFVGCIGVINARAGSYDADYGFDWVGYARLGLSAVIVAHPDGLEHAPWSEIAHQTNRSGMIASIPVNYVRLAATREIFQHIGERVHLQVKAVFENTPNRTIIGVLRCKQPTREALILTDNYDACSILPDCAPGTLQAITPAVQLQLLKGLVQNREALTRDIIFASFGSGVMADDGLDNLLRLLHRNSAQKPNRLWVALGLDRMATDLGTTASNSRSEPVRQAERENQVRLDSVQAIDHLCSEPAFLLDASKTSTLLQTLDHATAAFFDEQFAYVLNTVVFELSEPQLEAKIRFEKDPSSRIDGPEFKAYLAAKKEYSDASAASGFNATTLLREKKDFAVRYRIAERFRARIAELLQFHLRVKHQHDQELALVNVFDRYQLIAAFQPRLVPAFGAVDRAESISLDMAGNLKSSQADSFWNLIGLARQKFQIQPSDLSFAQYEDSSTSVAPNQAVRMWVTFGYPAYQPTSAGRSDAWERYAYPIDLPFMHEIESLRLSLAATGETLLSFARGNGSVQPFPVMEYLDVNFSGKVVVSGVGSSVVPNYPLPHALVAGGRSLPKSNDFSRVGHYENLFVFTDVYGRFNLPHNISDFPVWSWGYEKNFEYSPLAAGFGPDGAIDYMKDEGEDAQSIFKSKGLSLFSSTENVTIPVFRAAPVTVLDLTNPQSMRDFAGVQLMSRDGLNALDKVCSFEGLGLDTIYLPPDQRFYVQLMGGAADSPQVQTTRAFMLGIQAPHTFHSEREIDGPGYLAADSPFLLDLPLETARSMFYLNRQRLDLQNRYGMADALTNEYQVKAGEYLQAGEAAGQSQHDATRAQRRSMIYSMLNHPVLRESVSEAVLGILWYLGLLVPFVFFFEKLVFGFADVRKQLTALTVIFMTVFGLLRILHPAFQMVQSSVMILLGFVILLITGGITILFSGKFNENLDELRKRQGKVKAAQVDTLGAFGSAFMLGLNNMNRRKVRTGLTCATLTLLTFVMICFTSAQNNVVDSNVVIGKAPYQGLVVKHEKYDPLTDSEVFSLTKSYGEEYDVCPRHMYVGGELWQQFDKKHVNPSIHATCTSEGTTRSTNFASILKFSYNEPLRQHLKFLTQSTWFSADQQFNDVGLCPVLIPDSAAAVLGITADQVDRGNAVIEVNGQQFKVQGIFTAESLRAVRDLDGRDLLPYDVERIKKVASARDATNWQVEDKDPHIDAAKMLIAPVKDLHLAIANSRELISTLAISMPKAGYREAKESIFGFIEQTGETYYYGLDGIAYKGKRTRAVTLAGLVDILVPLLIAGLTVLNTMRGSVYERREEIFVYNAVGIAPRYIFFMFIAEAMVYAVVGTVLGYLLSQGVGKTLTQLHLTGGLNMTFTSISTIYASLAIIAAVFISTYFPARSAMEIAAPAEDAGWGLPDPEDDHLSLDLPFNFTARDRIAILIFFDRFLLDHGEGGAGTFHADKPRLGLAGIDDKAMSSPIPKLTATIWLKPFDLAVSQHLTLTFPVDTETGQYKAHLELKRTSGTRESWIRLNRDFVGKMRRQFLLWRAVPDSEREEMYQEAKAYLSNLYSVEVESTRALPV